MARARSWEVTVAGLNEGLCQMVVTLTSSAMLKVREARLLLWWKNGYCTAEPDRSCRKLGQNQHSGTTLRNVIISSAASSLPICESTVQVSTDVHLVMACGKLQTEQANDELPTGLKQVVGGRNKGELSRAAWWAIWEAKIEAAIICVSLMPWKLIWRRRARLAEFCKS